MGNVTEMQRCVKLIILNVEVTFGQSGQSDSRKGFGGPGARSRPSKSDPIERPAQLLVAPEPYMYEHQGGLDDAGSKLAATRHAQGERMLTL